MEKRITLFVMSLIIGSIVAWGQIKVNSSGKSFFGNGSTSTAYGTVNINTTGSNNGLAFTGTTANRYGIFRYDSCLYITPSNSIVRGLKMGPNGGIAITDEGLWGAWTKSTALVVTSRYSTTIQAHGYHSYSNADIITAVASRPDSYGFSVLAKYSWEKPFYVKGDGTVYAKNGYLQSSDINNKSDVSLINNSLKKISKLNAVSFYYRDYAEQTLKGLSELSLQVMSKDSSINNPSIETIEEMKKEVSRKRMGLIAQEVEKVVPEVVRTMDDGKKGIMYSDLVALLIEGIKELKDSLDLQQTEIQELKTRMQSIENIFYPKEKQLEKMQGKVTETNTSIMQEEITLYQNIPNPFNQETEISYRVPQDATAFIGIYNLNGQQLKRYSLTDKPSGKIVISASEFPAGIYIYSLVVDGQEVDSKRMVLTD